LLIVLLAVAACGGTDTAAPVEEAPAADTSAPAEEAAPTEEAAPAEEAAAPATDGPKYRIGVSNGFIGSEWRSQMLTNMEEVAQELNIELIIESGDVDIQGQTQQIQNLLNQDIDALIVNPNSTDALNPILEEAVASGIPVLAVDQETSAEGVTTVTIDQTEWGRIISRALFDMMGGEGDIVVIEGAVGHPANEYRMVGFDEVLADYPGINVVGRDSGGWDQATGQQVMSDFLASIPNIDGVWTQDGMAVGALRAVQTANPDEWPVMLGEGRAGYLQLWDEVRQTNPDFTAFAAVNPPGLAASGLRVMYEVLEGCELDTSKMEGGFNSTIHVPIPFTIDESNFEELLAEYKDFPESYTLDGIISQEDAASFCVGAASAAPAEEDMAETGGATPPMMMSADGTPFRVGVSNGFIGSEWRSQMLTNMEAVAQELGMELIIESGDVDIQGQTQQIQNLLNQDIDALIVNPNSTDALNPILEEAVASGIPVLAVDQETSAEGVTTVTIDQTEWGRIISRALFDMMGGEGDIVVIEGAVGHPANEYRMVGFDEVLADYPGINVVGRDSGGWDQATGQQVMSDFLASIPNIDGVWTQDGMAVGALRAVQTANPDEWPVMLGEGRAGYLQLWDEVRQTNPDFTAFAAVNPPGLAASGLRVMYEVLNGCELDTSKMEGGFNSTIHVPIPFTIDQNNFEELLAQYKDFPESYTLDGIISQEDAASFCK
jgi:ribose transport system substrate-binding protein